MAATWIFFASVISTIPTLTLCVGTVPLPSAQYLPLNQDQTLIVMEAENFTVSGAWEPREWAKTPNYYAATVNNVFHSRRAYLHGPAANYSKTDIASAAFTVPGPHPQAYSVLIRYEAPYRFEVPFMVTVTQHGAVKLSRVYGRRTNLKVWGVPYARSKSQNKICGPGLQTECVWPWGATENMVWEGVNITASLVPGPAEISFTPIHDSDYCCWGDRNIDTVLLHPNASAVDALLNSPTDGQVLPLDGMFSQLGEVFFKIQNMDPTHNLSVTVPQTYDHAPYYGVHVYLNKTTRYIRVPPGKTTGWVEVGGLMDTFNHGSWKVACNALPQWRVTPNETLCVAELQKQCVPPGPANQTTCLACVAKLKCPNVCINPATIDPKNPKSGNCSTTWIAVACKPPPPPPPPQELQCITTVVAACAQNKSAHGHPPYAPNQTKCLLCAKAITPCPKTCSMMVKNKSVCETAWFSAACRTMIPPRPTPPPRPPPPPQVLGPAHCIITMGIKSKPFDPTDTAVEALSNTPVFDSVVTGLDILFDASTRASKRARHNADDFVAVWDEITAQGKVSGKPPALVPIYAGTFPPFNDSTSSGEGPARNGYAAKQVSYISSFCSAENSCLCRDECATRKPPGGGVYSNIYVDVRTTNITKVTDEDPTLAARIGTVSLGDEISIVGHGNDTTFQAWCEQEKISLSMLGCHSWSACHLTPSMLNASGGREALFYYSQKYLNSAGIDQLKAKVAPMALKLKNAKFGANFSPTGYFTNPFTEFQNCLNYIGWTFQWVRTFREGALTLPWGEDWIWQTPVGTQQMMTLSIDAFRSGVYWVDEPATVSQELRASTWDNDTNIYTPLTLPPKHVDMIMYVMKHYPGNTNNSWTRQFFGDLSHGVTRFDLFNFVPSTSGYTCDYVDEDGGAYSAVHAGVNQLGLFEDIVHYGAAQANGAVVAILYSETSDIWLSSPDTFGSALRSTYIALKHAQLPIDILIEEDCVAGRLHYYKVLYVVLPHLTTAAATAIAQWVAGGGVVYGTAGAGLLNEANATNVAMETLYGIKVDSSPIYSGKQDPFNATVRLIKQDINFVDYLDNVTVANATTNQSLAVKGAKSMFKVVDPKTTQVLGTFTSDSSPALISTQQGKGQVFYAGFLPGLSYFNSAIPLRPVDRASVDSGMNHFIPTNFTTQARDVLTIPLAGSLNTSAVMPVVSNNNLVEVGFIVAPKYGTALPCVNWAGVALTDFNITLLAPLTYTHATLASGNTVVVSADKKVFTFDLGITADTLILR